MNLTYWLHNWNSETLISYMGLHLAVQNPSFSPWTNIKRDPVSTPHLVAKLIAILAILQGLGRYDSPAIQRDVACFSPMSHQWKNMWSCFLLDEPPKKWAPKREAGGNLYDHWQTLRDRFLSALDANSMKAKGTWATSSITQAHWNFSEKYRESLCKAPYDFSLPAIFHEHSQEICLHRIGF